MWLHQSRAGQERHVHSQPCSVASERETQKEEERGNELCMGKARTFLITDVTQPYTDLFSLQHPVHLGKSV